MREVDINYAYERIEYMPHGELWIEKASTASNIDIPYRFTGKERDEETGLYYYEARYLDSKASRWLSTDPALGDYIPGAPVDDEARKRNQSLPGMGGVFNTVNLHLYHYTGNNPVKYVDPDGRESKTLLENLVETATKAIVFMYQSKDARQKIGIGIAKVAMGISIAALGVGGGGVVTLGSGGAAISDGVSVAQEAIVAGGIYVGVGITDVLDGIVMMSQGNENGWRREPQNTQRSYNSNDQRDIGKAIRRIENETNTKLKISPKEWDSIHQSIGDTKARVNTPGSNQNLSMDDLVDAIKYALDMP